ncbi:MAG: thymidylate kinase, partial [Clostridia bacterium]|nr:thymidylate kinase [Clostridia bacterium]
ANAVHQLSKLPEEEYDGFLKWLFDLEYGKMGLPTPDLVLYMCVPPEVSTALIQSRSSQTGRATDIHENDKKHLSDSYKAALYSAEKLGWAKIDCASDGTLRTREDIHGEILRYVETLPELGA